MVAFSIGSIHIYRYGIFYAVGFALGYVWLRYVSHNQAFRSTNTRVSDFLRQYLDDLMLAIMLGVLIGGRLGHVFIYNLSYYLANPLEILAFWMGGMSFIGGFVWVVWAVWYLAVKHRLTGRDLLLLGDILVVPLPLAILLGRFGNFLNQELVGLPVSVLSDAGWSSLVSVLRDTGLTYVYQRVDMLERVNTNFLSMWLEWLLLRVVILMVLRRQQSTKSYFPGLIIGVFVAGYSLVRFGLEYLRQDSSLEYLWVLTISQYYFVIGVVVWVGMIRYYSSNGKAVEAVEKNNRKEQ